MASESMFGTVLGALVNIVLDPVLISAFNMGATGAAIATVIGNIVTVIYFLIYFLKGKSILSITPARFSMKNGITKGVVSVGLPAAINNLLMSISNIIVNVVYSLKDC